MEEAAASAPVPIKRARPALKNAGRRPA
jgi:hypothetical protein